MVLITLAGFSSVCVGIYGESSFLIHYQRGVFKPKNKLVDILQLLFAYGIPLFLGISSTPTVTGLSKWEWQVGVAISVIVIAFNTLGRIVVLSIWYVSRCFLGIPILVTNIQKSTAFLILIGGLGCLLVVYILVDDFWRIYTINTFISKNILLSLLCIYVILFEIMINYLRDVNMMLFFINGDIDLVAHFVPRLKKLLQDKYNYFAEYPVIGNDKLFELMEIPMDKPIQ